MLITPPSALNFVLILTAAVISMPPQARINLWLNPEFITIHPTCSRVNLSGIVCLNRERLRKVVVR